VVDISEFIKTENVLHVMSELEEQGVLTKDDTKKAMEMSREEWLKFMHEKVGISYD